MTHPAGPTRSSFHSPSRGMWTSMIFVQQGMEVWTMLYITSLPGSRDCPRPETLSFLDSSHLRTRRYRHTNHLLLFSSSLSTRTSMRDALIGPLDLTVDRFVASVHLCLDFAPRAEMTKCAGEVETRCARFAAASGSS
jgi:hypothetical protein